MELSFQTMWGHFLSCDSDYDGLFYAAVKTTKIYCRPSCRSRKPLKKNVVFYKQRAEAEKAGFRACKRCQPDYEQSPQWTLAANVKAFLLENYKKNITLQNISTHIGVSPFYLERQFKKVTSQTPRTFLEKIRIDKADQLLRQTDMPILDICYESGFSSPSTFYSVFKRLKKMTPKECRKGRSQS